MRKIIWTTLPIAALAVGFALGPTEVAAQQRGRQQQQETRQRSVVIHLTKSTGDLHAVAMALDLAKTLADAGANVTLFLDLEGVRLADKRLPHQLRWGSLDRTIGQLYEDAVSRGTEVLLCSHCAEQAGLTRSNLREGARLATPQTLSKAIFEANQVIDY